MKILNKKYVFLFLISVLLAHSQQVYSQKDQLFPFEIKGHIKADTGTIKLEILGYSGYYPTDIGNKIAKVENNEFSFRGSIPYPLGVTLSYGNLYSSRLFIIEPGTQTITCNIEDAREVPKVDNQAMKEYEGEYKKAYEQVRKKNLLWNDKRDSLKQVYQNEIPDTIQFDLEQEIKGIYAESDSTLLRYVTVHPNSYVALWKLIELFSFYGYESIFDSIFAQFSDSLKSTYTGKVLAQKLETAGMMANGKKFPPIAAVDRQNDKLDQSAFSKNEYTFIDFWYSGCHPCIAQFPHLRDTYANYKDKGFEIIGISTDRIKDEEKWKKAIQKYKLSWPQYWDQNGVASSKLSINKFPTNFLLDSKGHIIKKDLRPVELEQFLWENLR